MRATSGPELQQIPVGDYSRRKCGVDSRSLTFIHSSAAFITRWRRSSDGDGTHHIFALISSRAAIVYPIRATFTGVRCGDYTTGLARASTVPHTADFEGNKK